MRVVSRRQAHGVDPRSSARADAHADEVLAEHDRVGLDVLATFQANSSSPHSASLGARWVTTSISPRSRCRRRGPGRAGPPSTWLDVALAGERHAALVVLEDPQVLLLGEDLERAVVVAGREDDLDELLAELLGERPGRSLRLTRSRRRTR
jgi:hypothetical protein